MLSRRAVSKLLAGSAAFHGLGRAQTQPSPHNMPKFSCMLWTLEHGNSFERCLEIVAGAGYDGVELVGEFHRWSASQLRDTLQQIHALNLVVDASSGVEAGFAVPDQRARFLSQCGAQIATMQQLGCRRMILLSGAVVPDISPAQQRQAALEGLQRACDLAAAAGIEVLIEPIDPLENPAIYLRSVTDAFEIVSTLHRPNLKVLYDLYHEQRGAGNLIDKLTAHFDQVGLIHVADVPGRHEPGTGEIRYPAIYRTLAEHGYSGWIAMEFMPTGDPQATLRTAREEVRRSFLRV